VKPYSTLLQAYNALLAKVLETAWLQLIYATQHM
jgi:hypothetical protein